MITRRADVEAAKEFIVSRLAAERSMTRNLESFMRDAAERIVAVCFRHGASPRSFSIDKLPPSAREEIDGILDWLRGMVEDCFVTLAVADHEEDRDAVLPLILGVRHGRSFSDRLGSYIANFRGELGLLAKAGLVLGLGLRSVSESVAANLRHPYSNPLLSDGVEEPRTYGRGRTNSMFTAIDALTRDGIAVGWMRHWEMETVRSGAVGWEVRRGSSYPCPACDENCGFHSADEGLPLPVHNSCCCYAVPIYKL